MGAGCALDGSAHLEDIISLIDSISSLTAAFSALENAAVRLRKSIRNIQSITENRARPLSTFFMNVLLDILTAMAS